MKIFEKQPAEVLDYYFDFRIWLTSKSDNAVSYVLEPQAGITVSTHSSPEPGLIKLFLAEGLAGVRYKITCRITTTGGRVKEAEFLVKVKEY